MKFGELTQSQKMQACNLFGGRHYDGLDYEVDPSGRVLSRSYRPPVEFVCSYCMEKVIAPHYCMAKYSQESC